MNQFSHEEIRTAKKRLFASSKGQIESPSLPTLRAVPLTAIQINNFHCVYLPYSIASSPYQLININLTRLDTRSRSINTIDYGTRLDSAAEWGIYISLQTNAFLVIGSLSDGHFDAARNNPCSSFHCGLLPGDVIISLNLRPISSYGGLFKDIINDMQSFHQIHFQLIRCMEGTKVATCTFSEMLRMDSLRKFHAQNNTPTQYYYKERETREFHYSSPMIVTPDSSTKNLINQSNTRRELCFGHSKSKHKCSYSLQPLKRKRECETHCPPTQDMKSTDIIYQASLAAAKRTFYLLEGGLNYVMNIISNYGNSHIRIDHTSDTYIKSPCPFNSTNNHQTIHLPQQQIQQCKKTRKILSTTIASEDSMKKSRKLGNSNHSKSPNSVAALILQNEDITNNNLKTNTQVQYKSNHLNQKKIQNNEIHHCKVNVYRNNVWIADTRTFRNHTLKGSPLFDDNHIDLFDDYEDGERNHLFLNPAIEMDYPTWLQDRKQTWRKKWNICKLNASYLDANEGYSASVDDNETSINTQFWLQNDFPTFQHWLTYSTTKWKRSYSWHKQKRQILEKDQIEVVHFPTVAGLMGTIDTRSMDDVMPQWLSWLRVRKNQWKVMIRKRQRRLKEEAIITQHANDEIKTNDMQSISTSTLVHIDAHIEDEENQTRSLQNRPPLDISFLFFPDLGAPDDVISQIISFLPRSDHGTILCINYVTSEAIKLRVDMWKNMCPKHWILPRRPRRPWHVIYITKLREEEEIGRKKSDGVLINAAGIMCKGDHLNKLERLVNSAEKRFRFDPNYVSAVVLDRNSLLNLSVYYRRHRITKWLVESKNVDIETSDRGNFTPLLNAAWAGDRYLVRFLLGKKADKRKVGTAHYSTGLAHPDFKGLTAECWARKRGFSEIADLIQLGLS